MAMKTVIISESGMVVGDGIQHEIMEFLNQKEEFRNKKNLVVSLAGKAHRAKLNEADYFIGLSNSDRVLTEKIAPCDLMLEAFKMQISNASRVGAAALTRSGAIFSSSELGPSSQNFIKGELQAAIEGIKNPDDILEFLDVSTSVHAETIVVLEAIKRGEIPSVVSTTKLPCLACCRLMRFVGVESINYIEYGGRSPSAKLMSLMCEALDGCRISVYVGPGFRT